MGKKSNAKKIKRQLKEEEKHKEQKKVEIKKEPAKETEKPKKRIIKLKEHKNKILGGALAIIMIAALAAVGWLLFEKAFKPAPIAKYLPADKTAFILEINSNINHKQFLKAEKLLENSDKYSKNKLIEYLEDKFLFDYKNEVEPWLGREVGMAGFNGKNQEADANLVYFAEIYSQKGAEKYITDKTSKTNYLDRSIYTAKDGYNYYFIDDYLFVSKEINAIKELIEYKNNLAQSLYTSPEYRKIEDNLPLNKTAFAYINFSQLSDNVINNVPFSVQPFMKLFKSEGMALIALDDKFALQSFINLDIGDSSDIKYFTSSEKYSARLADYAAQDAVIFWGGKNLINQLENTQSQAAFINFLQAYTEKYFGPEVNFEKDIMPFFENEFALAVEKMENKNIYKVIFELKNPASDIVKLHEIADNFAETGAYFEPKVVEHVLEDGTVSKEIIAVPEEITRKGNIYKDVTIHELQMGKDRDWGIFYAVIENTAVISTNIEGVKSALDAKNKEKISLKNSKKYTTLIEPVLQYSDDVVYFDIENLLPQLDPIFAVSSGKTYSNGGISAISYLQLK